MNQLASINQFEARLMHSRAEASQGEKQKRDSISRGRHVSQVPDALQQLLAALGQIGEQQQVHRCP